MLRCIGLPKVCHMRSSKITLKLADTNDPTCGISVSSVYVGNDQDKVLCESQMLLQLPIQHVLTLLLSFFPGGYCCPWKIRFHLLPANQVWKQRTFYLTDIKDADPLFLWPTTLTVPLQCILLEATFPFSHLSSAWAGETERKALVILNWAWWRSTKSIK